VKDNDVLLFAAQIACHIALIRRGRDALVCLDRNGSRRLRLAGGDVRVLPRRAPKTRSVISSPRVADRNNLRRRSNDLAVDVSYSMDMDELAIPARGLAQAIVSKEFLQALKTARTARFSDYFEWAASTDQKIIIPWRVIDARRRRTPSPADHEDPSRRASRTSISGAIISRCRCSTKSASA